jgi:hypothetical protein
MIGYLLNDLPEPEQRRFEEQYFADPGFFEQLQAVEEELIEDYVRERLSAPQRANFERHYLATPERRERVAFARELCDALSREPAARTSEARSWWRARVGIMTGQPQVLGYAAALTLLVVGGGTWLLVELQGPSGAPELAASSQPALVPQAQDGGLPRAEPDGEPQESVEPPEAIAKTGAGREPSQARASRTPSRRAQYRFKLRTQGADRSLAFVVPPEASPSMRDLREPSQARASHLPSPVVKSVLLASGAGSRGEGGVTPQLVLPADAELVELRVARGAEAYSRYGAVVRTVTDGTDGKEIWRTQGLEARPTRAGREVWVQVPATQFRGAGVRDYILELSGRTAGGYEAVEEYYFRVAQE